MCTPPEKCRSKQGGRSPEAQQQGPRDQPPPGSDSAVSSPAVLENCPTRIARASPNPTARDANETRAPTTPDSAASEARRRKEIFPVRLQMRCRPAAKKEESSRENRH